MLLPSLPAARASTGDKLGAAAEAGQRCWHTALTVPGHLLDKGQEKGM